jgi:squalene cyclase
LNGAGLKPDHATMKRGADWLVAIQNPDGGWGENCDSYRLDYKGYEPAPSTASQTAWALLGLMAAGQVDHPAMARGVNYLKATQQGDGLWSQPHYTVVASRASFTKLSRLSEILPALGPGALPQSQDQQFAPGRVRPMRKTK